jgi:replicative DNA helicase
MPSDEDYLDAELVLKDMEEEFSGQRINYISTVAALDIFATDLDKRRSGEIVGLSWPKEWPALSRRVGLIEPGSLTIIAARPSVGKTMMGLQLARALAGNGASVLFVSRELSVARLIRRQVAAYGASLRNLSTGQLSDNDVAHFDAYMSESKNWSLYYDHTSTSIAEIREQAVILKPDIIIIDYLQRLAYDTEKEYAAITRIVNELQDVTLTLNVPVVCLSQLSRPQKGYEWKAPTMSDTRGSGAVEERAANLIILHRFWESEEEESYGKKIKVAGSQTENGWFIVSKCADGETGSPIKVHFDGARMRITEKIPGLS